MHIMQINSQIKNKSKTNQREREKKERKIMAKTYTELKSNFISNENFKIRYTMENGNPLFVVTDIFKSLDYKAPGVATAMYCKKLGLGKVVYKNARLMTYAETEEMEAIFDSMRRITPEFRDFWNNQVLPATDTKYRAINDRLNNAIATISGLTTKLEEEKDKNSSLQAIVHTLNGEISTLTDQVNALRGQVETMKKERAAISSIILGNVA